MRTSLRTLWPMSISVDRKHCVLPEACGRVGSEVFKVESGSCPSLSANLWGTGPVLCVYSTTRPTLLVELWISHHQSCEDGKAVPTPP